MAMRKVICRVLVAAFVAWFLHGCWGVIISNFKLGSEQKTKAKLDRGDPNIGSMEDNFVCKDMQWDKDAAIEEAEEATREAREAEARAARAAAMCDKNPRLKNVSIGCDKNMTISHSRIDHMDDLVMQYEENQHNARNRSVQGGGAQVQDGHDVDLEREDTPCDSEPVHSENESTVTFVDGNWTGSKSGDWVEEHERDGSAQGNGSQIIRIDARTMVTLSGILFAVLAVLVVLPMMPTDISNTFFNIFQVHQVLRNMAQPASSAESKEDDAEFEKYAQRLKACQFQFPDQDTNNITTDRWKGFRKQSNSTCHKRTR